MQLQSNNLLTASPFDRQNHWREQPFHTFGHLLLQSMERAAKLVAIGIACLMGNLHQLFSDIQPEPTHLVLGSATSNLVTRPCQAVMEACVTSDLPSYGS